MDSDSFSINTIIGFAIVLCLVALILSILSFTKPDKKLAVNNKGFVDPNYITINSFLDTSQAKKFMINHLTNGAGTSLIKKSDKVIIKTKDKKDSSKLNNIYKRENGEIVICDASNKGDECVNPLSFTLS